MVYSWGEYKIDSGKQQSIKNNMEGKKVLKTIGKVAFWSAVVVGGAVAIFVVAYPPKQGKRCRRSLFRDDGVPKKAFKSRIRANWQSVIQLFRHGELCTPYQIDGKFYTGHNRELNKAINRYAENAFQAAVKTAEVTAEGVSYGVMDYICNQSNTTKQTFRTSQCKGNCYHKMRRNESYFDVTEDEYDNLSEEEQEEIDENQLDFIDDYMFPDGRDDE